MLPSERDFDFFKVPKGVLIEEEMTGLRESVGELISELEDAPEEIKDLALSRSLRYEQLRLMAEQSLARSHRFPEDIPAAAIVPPAERGHIEDVVH